MVNYLPRMNGNNNIGNTNQGWAPNITGNTGGCVSNGTPRGCFYQSTQVSTAGGGAGRFYENGFNASRSSSVYNSNVTSVMCASIVMNYCIKF